MSQNDQKELLIRFCREKGNCIVDDFTYYTCASFLFYTSWFEELLFNFSNRQGGEKNEKICKELSELVNLSEYDSYGQYFSNRYISGSRTTNEFRNLKLRRDDAHIVKRSLEQYKANGKRDWELLWSYLMIAYRFRNNMFHGSKGLVNLSSYIEQFKMINQFLRQLIGDIIDNNYTGYN